MRCIRGVCPQQKGAWPATSTAGIALGFSFASNVRQIAGAGFQLRNRLQSLLDHARS